MIASLMMYLRPELAEAHARYWTLIHAGLAARGIPAPERLRNEAEEFAVWNAPDLTLSQTCGMPYRLLLHERVTLVGTPDFGVQGCPPGYYNSVFVVRRNDPRETIADFRRARFAYNQSFSQSGYAAPYAHCAAQGFWFEDRSQSHSHRTSAQAVAGGRAEIAALDAVSWRMIQRYDAFAADLRVLTRTTPTPGLPYIAGAKADRSATFDAVSEAIAGLLPEDAEALGIRGLVAIPKAAYLAVPSPPKGA
ncbi:phosphate/phosphite/phosphonate ABC transporter substrate-binding protein [Sulfitobacter delicatus]|uniref:ABC transporter, phosphonate, substrate-binding protein n=1 Tax=Sulfitobacter delicatus TaxID=218672 RepID=A0A1G7W831_9RHOB|nr:PhnD/SsuA/transferrin family substrate-binding protein [Sulfitobacter delicatus]SDG68106.1 ABC transporter, phosphonate, substrate-binding protein [Sulfitobacter delicatus]